MNGSEQPVFDVSGAVAVLNQTLEYAFPLMYIVGEVSQFQVSKGKWVYFDIKDAESKLKCFASAWSLRMPLEDGMRVHLVARPRLHNLYGFSLTVESVRPVGEGSLKKAADLLREKLAKEGLFEPERKRSIPYPPERIALVASRESAAYADFMKIIRARWPLLDVRHYDVSVQGAQAETDIVSALRTINESFDDAEAIVIIRGGGSADDLSAFSTEPVVRAIAASRVPTVVAIGHETDVSLAELAADLHASTPSNAAELLVPDHKVTHESLLHSRSMLKRSVNDELKRRGEQVAMLAGQLSERMLGSLKHSQSGLEHARLRLDSYHPNQVLKRGYALVRKHGKVVTDVGSLSADDSIEVELEQGIIDAAVIRTRKR